MVRLTGEEWLVLTGAELHRATHRLCGVFSEELASVVRPFISELLSGRWYLFQRGVGRVSGRVVRGYNLGGCPYVALDYPSFSCGGDVLILRVLVWFGVAVCVCIIGEGTPATLIESGIRRLGRYLPSGMVVHAGKALWSWPQEEGISVGEWLSATAQQNNSEVRLRLSLYERVEEGVRLLEVVRKAVPWLVAVLQAGQESERINSASASCQ